MINQLPPEDPRKTLADIKNLMERSSRFFSLSGLSGVAAGIWALLGAAAVYWYCDLTPFEHKYIYYQRAIDQDKLGIGFYAFLFLVAAITIAGAVLTAWFFTHRKAKREGLRMWDKSSQNILLHLAIPLITGGIFCLAMIKYGHAGFLAPVTLIFYGLALVNASKFTFNDVLWLGISEIILGLIAMFSIGHGLEFWALGFGVLHII